MCILFSSCLSVPITPNVVSLNHAHCEVYLIQHVFKFVNDLQQVSVLDTTLCVQVCQWLAAGRCTWYNIMCSSLSMSCSRSVYLIQHYVFNDLQQVGVLDTTLCVQVCQWLAAGRCTWYNIMCSSLSMTCSRSVYLLQHYVFKFVNDLQQVSVLATTLCVQVCQWLAAGRCTWYNIMCSSLSVTCSRSVYLIQHYVFKFVNDLQ
jgi:hypothetical protein